MGGSALIVSCITPRFLMVVYGGTAGRAGAVGDSSLLLSFRVRGQSYVVPLPALGSACPAFFAVLRTDFNGAAQRAEPLQRASWSALLPSFCPRSDGLSCGSRSCSGSCW